MSNPTSDYLNQPTLPARDRALRIAVERLRLIADLEGKTLISMSHDQIAYGAGAHAAFGQTAGIARDALDAIRVLMGEAR